MNMPFMWFTPFAYLLIVGFERLFWRSRYEKIKADIPLNVFSLTMIVLVANAFVWVSNHLEICWK